jgi:integrase
VAAKQARAAAELQRRDGVAVLAAEFIEKHAKRATRTSSWMRTKSIFDRIVLPAWRARTVHEIRRRDVIDLIEAIAEGNKNLPPRPILANRMLAVLSKFFNWLVSRDVIVASPAHGVARPGRETVRERVLTDAELRQLWLACDEINPRYGAAIRLLVLTAQRRNEVAWLPRAEIDKDTRLWTLPAQRAKNNRTNTIPLSTQAWDIVSNVSPGRNPALVFGGELKDFGRIKRELDVRLRLTAPWVLHDLRRSAASGLQKVGTPIHIIEQILGHRSGVFRGIVGVYQKHVYDTEKAAALQRWGDYVERLVTGQAEDNVLAMTRR